MKPSSLFLILAVSLGLSSQFALAQSPEDKLQKPTGNVDNQYQPPLLRGISPADVPHDDNSGKTNTSTNGSDAGTNKDLGDIGNIGNLKADSSEKTQPLSAVVQTSVSVNVDTGAVPQDHGLYGIRLKVVNDTKEPLIFDGDNVLVSGNNRNLSSSPVPEMDTTGFPPCIKKSNFKAILESGLTVGAIPTVKDMKIAKGPKLERYGCDELRRENEVARFGKRVVWPGATSTGIVYFKAQPLKGSTLQIPVSELFDTSEKAVVTTAF